MNTTLGFYRLEGHEAVPMDDSQTIEWAYHLGKTGSLARDTVRGFDVSTIFLGLNQDILALLIADDEEPHEPRQPLIFETMVFNGQRWVQGLYLPFHRKRIARIARGGWVRIERAVWRYSTWDQAQSGHAAVVERIRKVPAGPYLTRRIKRMLETI